MRRSRLSVLSTAVGALVAAGALTGPAAAHGGGLVAFSNCGAFLGYAKAHARPYVSAYGLGTSSGLTATGSSGKVLVPSVAANATGPASLAAGASASTSNQAPQEGVNYSGTNNQEAGVDEPDIVKTNGNTLFTVENGQLEAVDVSSPQPRLLDTLPLNEGWNSQLLLYGTHLLVLSRGGGWLEPLPAEPAQIVLPPQLSSATLTEIDVSNPSDMTVMGTMTLDGSYLDARMVGSTVRVVTSTPMPLELPYETPTGAAGATPLAAARTHNRRLVASSRLSAWIPTYTLGGRTRELVNCRDIMRPVDFSGLGMLTVSTIDLSQGLTPLDTTSIMTDGQIVYASPTTLFVATQEWADRPLPTAPELAPAGVTTQIAAFDISNPTRTVYLGSGTVPGYLLDQWSMSEYNGVLRVVSTDTPAWWGQGPASQSYLTTLEPMNGGLAQIGQVGGLGQGERVYSVRMIGNMAFVSTFQQVDPLYTIDLQDPSHPRVVGELDLPGYSSYLQPVGTGLLLGVGEDVDPTTNEPTGTVVRLFNVSDPMHPSQVASDALGYGWSAVESDSHAFLYWPATGLVVVPFGQEAVALHVSPSGGLSELGRIVQENAPTSSLPDIDRALVAGSALFTVSSAGVASNGLADLANIGWAAFPQPTPPPTPAPPPTPGPVPIVPAPEQGIAVGK